MDWPTAILTILAVTFGIYYAFYKRRNELEKMGIEHIKPLPFFGNTGSMLARRYHISEMVDKIYRINEDAKYVGFFDFSQPVVVIRSPELIKSIAVKNFDHFMDHRGFTDPDVDPMFGKNLISLRGERWKTMRNLLTPAFTGSKMKTMFKLMSNCGKSFADFLEEKSASEPNVLDTKEAFTRYTNDVIATCAFGISIDSMRNPNNDFYIYGRKMTKFDGLRAIQFFISRSFPRIARLLNLKFIAPEIERFFINVVKETIETRDREGINRPDMIQLMMETRKNKSNGGIDLSIQDMTAQAMIFFFGGFDSSATAMCFIAHLIAINPEVQEKLVNEIDNIMEESNGEPTYEQVNGMQYLEAVISETMRLYPINIALDRLCVKTFELPPALPNGKPITIEPGQNVWFPAFSIHRDAKYFPEPEKFDPERFFGVAKNNVDPFTYFPFGQGPRMCIANRFALLEIKVLFVHLLAKCRLGTSSKMRLPLELSKSSITMAPEGGFWLELEARNSSVVK